MAYRRRRRRPVEQLRTSRRLRGWHAHHDDDDGRGPVEPALPAKAIECDRDCQVRKQREKEQAEAVQVPAADYDISNDENIHNAVTDAESSGLNQERGTKAASA